MKMKRKTRRRFFAGFLSMVVAFSSLSGAVSTPVYAAEASKELVIEVTEDEIRQILKDTEYQGIDIDPDKLPFKKKYKDDMTELLISNLGDKIILKQERVSGSQCTYLLVYSDDENAVLDLENYYDIESEDEGEKPSEEITKKPVEKPDIEAESSIKEPADPSEEVPEQTEAPVMPKEEVPESTETPTEPSTEEPESTEVPTDPSVEIPESTEAPTEPSVKEPESTEMPTEPSMKIPESTEAPTEPSIEIPESTEAPTEPSIEIPESTEAPTEPSMEIPESTEAPTEPSVEAPESTEAPTEPSVEMPESTGASTAPSVEAPAGPNADIAENTEETKAEDDSSKDDLAGKVSIILINGGSSTYHVTFRVIGESIIIKESSLTEYAISYDRTEQKEETLAEEEEQPEKEEAEEKTPGDEPGGSGGGSGEGNSSNPEDSNSSGTIDEEEASEKEDSDSDNSAGEGKEESNGGSSDSGSSGGGSSDSGSSNGGSSDSGNSSSGGSSDSGSSGSGGSSGGGSSSSGGSSGGGNSSGGSSDSGSSSSGGSSGGGSSSSGGSSGGGSSSSGGSSGGGSSSSGGSSGGGSSDSGSSSGGGSSDSGSSDSASVTISRNWVPRVTSSASENNEDVLQQEPISVEPTKKLKNYKNTEEAGFIKINETDLSNEYWLTGVVENKNTSRTRSAINLDEQGMRTKEIKITSFGNSISQLDVLTDAGEETSVFDYADSLFGEDAEEQKPLAEVSVESVIGESKDPLKSKADVMAGQTVKYIIRWQAYQTPNYKVNGNPRPVYDTLTNTSVEITLPKGIVLKDQSYASVAGDAGTTYTIPLEDVSGLDYGSHQASFELDAYVEGNGSAETLLGTEYNFDPIGDASITGTMTVYDQEHQNADGTYPSRDYTVTSNGSYSMAIATSIKEGDTFAYTYTLISPDQWGITKKLNKQNQGSEFRLEEKDDKNYLVVEYELNVGLKNGNNGLKTLDDEYKDFGRAAFTNYTLTDTLTFNKKNQDGTSISINPEQLTIELVSPDGREGNVSSDEITKTVEETSEISISTYSTLGNNGSDGKVAVSDTAPAYSTYKVTAHYDYAAFKADFWSEDAVDKDAYTVENKAKIAYTFAERDVKNRDAVSEIVPVKHKYTKKGSLTITKSIEEPTGSGTQKLAYNETAGTRYTGYAGFELYRNDGSDKFVKYDNIYIEDDAAKSGYSLLEQNGLIWINPKAEEADGGMSVMGTDGSVTVYVEPGEYKIKEVTAPNGTSINPDEQGPFKIEAETDKPNPAKIEFVNKASEMGGIQFIKLGRHYDESGKVVETPLEGAKFGLWKSGDGLSAEPFQTAESAKDTGIVSFYPLTAGKYVIKELSAPDGYLKDTTEYTADVEKGVIVSINAKDGSKGQNTSIVNEENLGLLIIQKQVLNYNKNAYEYINSERAKNDFTGAFSVEKFNTSTNGWEVVKANISLTEKYGNNPAAVLKLPVYEANDVNGTRPRIQYRVVEKVPDAYTSLTEVDGQTYDGTTEIVTSKTVELSPVTGVDSDKVASVIIKNKPLGSIIINKYIKVYNDSNPSLGKKENVRFELYRKTDKDSAPILVSEIKGVQITEEQLTTDKNGQIQLKNLPMADENGNVYEYYLREVNQEPGYQISWESGEGGKSGLSQFVNTLKTIVSGEAENENKSELAGPINLKDGADTVFSIYNVKQEIPIWIKKTDAISGEKVDGAGFTVYAVGADGTEVPYTRVQEGTTDAITYENVPGNSDTPVMLAVGSKYVIRETTPPEGYYGYEGENSNGIVVDLTKSEDFKLGHNYTVSSGTEFGTTGTPGEFSTGNGLTFKNIPYPKLEIEKKVKRIGVTTDEIRTGVEFEIYPALENGEISSVPVGAVKSGEQNAVSLVDGTYYLKEITPSDIIKPELVDSLTGSDNVVKVTDSAGTVYFKVKLEKPAPSETGSNAVTVLNKVTIHNYVNAGAAEVLKQDAWTPNAPLSGAEFTLFRVGTDGAEALVSEAPDPVISGSDGKAVFKGMPIYDETGVKITYRVRETKAPSRYSQNKEVYYDFKLNETAVVTQGTNAVNTSAADMIFQNEHELSVITYKYWYDGWQSHFHETLNELPGIELALFYQEKGAGPIKPMLDGNGSPVVKTTSSADAGVKFDGLNQHDTYYIIEVYKPEKYELPSGTNPLLTGGELGDTTAEKLINTYGINGIESINSHYYTAFNYQDLDSAKKNEAGKKYDFYLDNLKNEKPWTQIHVTKYAESSLLEVTEAELSAIPEAEKAGLVQIGDKYYRETSLEPSGSKELLNGAAFNLYEQTLPAGESPVTVPDFETLKKVGTYESGTRLDKDGKPIDGEFMTTILEPSSNKIFWLVEVKAPIGGIMDPAKSVIAVVPEAMESISIEGVSQVIRYNRNAITDIKIENYKAGVGGGEGDLTNYNAYLILNKWLEVAADGGAKSYKPLGGVGFSLRIKDTDVEISYLETGLDNDLDMLGDPALLSGSAMSGYLRYSEIAEKLTAYIQQKNPELTSSEDIQKELNKYIQIDSENQTATIQCELVEVKAPGKVEMSKEVREVTLVAENGKLGVNDEYYYRPKTDSQEASGKQIINKALGGYAVTVKKWGFIPDKSIFEGVDSAGIGDEQLDAISNLPGKTPLSGVEFKLSRYDEVKGAWVETETFVSGTGGEYTFKNGLVQGYYRLVETKLGNANKAYFNMHPNNKSARYFKVDSENTEAKVISVYNPKLPDLEITKKAVDENSPVDLSGLKFVLNKNNKTKAEATIESGKTTVYFTGLEPGEGYVLTENKGTNSDVTTDYFTNYNPKYKKFTLGYKLTGDEPNMKNLSASKVFEDYGSGLLKGSDDIIDGKVSIKITNPRYGGLQLQKVNNETDLGLSGAKFKYQYKAFENNDFSTKPDGGQFNDNTLKVPTSGWSADIKVDSSKKELVTDKDGFLKRENLVPGWYKVTELEAPDGYTNAGESVYIAVTGDMTGTYVPVTSKDNAGNDLKVENRQKVNLTLTKKLSAGETKGLETEQPSKVTFDLYKGAGSAEIAGMQKIDTIVFDTFKEGSASADIKGGLDQLKESEAYYLKESTEGQNNVQWYLSSAFGTVENDGNGQTPLEADVNGFIKLPGFTTSAKVSVEVTNILGKAQLTVNKTDTTASKNPVSGAEFEVYAQTALDPQTSIITGEPLGKGTTGADGTCMITVTLTSQGEAVYYLVEKSAPNHIVDSKPIPVSLKPGDNVTGTTSGYEEILNVTNRRGADIELKKYADIYENRDTASVQESDATFVLYSRAKNTNGTFTEAEEPKTADADGILNWKLDIEANEYALYEPEISSGTYRNYTLESIHPVIEGKVQEEALDTTVQDGKTLHLLNLNLDGENPAAGYSFYAYNRPATKITLKKQAADWKSEDAVPTAKFRITGTALDGSVINEETEFTKPDADSKTTGASSLSVQLKSGTYTIEEIETVSPYGIVKNMTGDKLSVWKHENITVPNNAVNDTYTFMNMTQGIKAELSKKTLTDHELDSLLWTVDSQEVEFEISLKGESDESGGVISDMPLNSFVLRDTGFTMQALDDTTYGTLTDPVYTYNKYNITEVTIPLPTDNTDGLVDEAGIPLVSDEVKLKNNIEATVTFYGFDVGENGKNIVGTVTGIVDDLASSPSGARVWTLNVGSYVPAGTNVSSFDVTYVNRNLPAESGYALGRNFNPGTLTLKAQVFRQEQSRIVGTEETPQTETLSAIRKIVNKADMEVFYSTYSQTGTKNAPVSFTDNDEAEVLIKEPDVPTVQVSKTLKQVKRRGQILDKTQAAPYIQVEDIVTYELTLTNVSGENGTADTDQPMVNPIFYDKLPKGMSLMGDTPENQYDVGIKSSSNLSIDSMRVRKGTTIDNQTYLYIPFAGNLEKGDSITIKYEVKVTNGIINNALDIRNEVNVTSTAAKDAFTNNPGGATFKVWNENQGKATWPTQLTDAEDDLAYAQLFNGTQGLGFGKSYALANMTGNSGLMLLKEVKGDKDDHYMLGEEVALASLNGGTVSYKLTVKNTDKNRAVDRLSIMDVLPVEGDKSMQSGYERLSKWAVDYNPDDPGFHAVKYTSSGEQGETGEDVTSFVTRYYYSGDAVLTKTDLQNFNPDTAGPGWGTEYPGTRVKAIAFDMDDSITLGSDERLVITFTTNVAVNPDNQQEVEEAVYDYAVNDYMLKYFVKGETVMEPLIQSNKVNATLTPELVRVGGRIWIDSNNNGIQDDTEPYLDDIVEKLGNSGVFTVTLQKMGSETSYKEGPIGQFNGNERFTSFYFDELMPSKPQNGKTDDYPYNSSSLAKPEINWILQPGNLQGKAPQHYKVIITMDSEKAAEAIPGLILEKAKTGMLTSGGKNTDSGKSRRPESLYNQDENLVESLDNNFIKASQSGQKGTYESEDFFLWATNQAELYDHTKDFGLIAQRQITLRKTASQTDIKGDNQKPSLAGAEFAIYGPFETPEEAGKPEAFDKENEKYRGITGEDGMLSDIPRLEFFKNYLIVEEKSAENYMLDRASANLVSVETDADKAAWLLPANTNLENLAPSDILVENRYEEGSLTFDKVDSDTNELIEDARFLLVRDGRQLAGNNLNGAWEDFVATVKKSGAVNGLRDIREEISDEMNPEAEENNAISFTAADGHVRIDGLPKGDYMLIETKAPKGYALGDKPLTRSFTIAGKDTKIDYTVSGEEGPLANDPHRTTVTKVDKDNHDTRLSGAVFILQAQDEENKGQYILLEDDSFAGFTENESRAGQFTTNSVGMVTIKRLPEGTYRLIEKQAPAGYEINHNIEEFTTDGIDLTVNILVEDTAIPKSQPETPPDNGSGNGSGGGGSRDRGSRSRNNSNDTIEILASEVPLAVLPETPETIILDDNVPLAGLPKTGDHTATFTFAGMLTMAMAGLFLMIEKRKKRDEDGK